MRLRVIYVPDDETWGVELDGQAAIRFSGADAQERAGELAAELRTRIPEELPWLEGRDAARPENH